MQELFGIVRCYGSHKMTYNICPCIPHYFPGLAGKFSIGIWYNFCR